MMRMFKKWMVDTAGTAIAEFALIFPLLMTMLIGVYEIGNAVQVNQRAIAASQVIADLIARNVSVDDDIIDEAIRAGELAVSPFGLDDMGVDIVSVQFDDQDHPQELWRETRNMDPNPEAPDNTEGLGVFGDGALVVTVSYTYHPFFGSMLIDEIPMQEIAFARGRRTATVSKDD